jgi:hypothetical protein
VVIQVLGMIFSVLRMAATNALSPVHGTTRDGGQLRPAV